MSYQDDLIAHLIEYKRNRLGAPPAGTYRYRGRDVRREHILPIEARRLNFLEESREEIVSFLRSNPQVKLHKYFHHLNSSQAFALNLFVPFFEGGPAASTALLSALGQHATLVGWEPESVPDTAEETNLDAVWDTSDGARTFCEVKLSERDFGKARLDTRHLDKLRDIYLPRLAQYLSPELHEAPSFFESYQVLRNIWHMVGAPDGRLVFLIPLGNSKLQTMLKAVISRVSEKVRDRIRAAAIEEVLDRLSSDTRNPPHFRAYAQELREKYVPRPSAV
jgi:restriction endonuclease-like protein